MPAMHDDGHAQPEAAAPAAVAEAAASAPMVEPTDAPRAETTDAPTALPAAPVAAAAPVRAGLAPAAAPRVSPAAFVLPLAELHALAEQAGLQWVGSDADKVAAAQAAMAAEPQPIHVPRLPKPAVVLDEGPLVLVETRKDLSQLKLPFDHSASS